MNIKLKITEKDGVIEIVEEEIREEPRPVAEDARQQATSYYITDGNGHAEKFETYFNITTPQKVEVKTRHLGKVDLTTNLYEVFTGIAGPKFPHNEGGKADLPSGYWHMYFTGTIQTYPKPAEFYATVYYT